MTETAAAAQAKNSGISVVPPLNFSFVPGEWTKWRRRFERYRIASGMAQTQNEEEQVNSLIYIMGEQADDIFLSFTLTEAQKKLFKNVMECFENQNFGTYG